MKKQDSKGFDKILKENLEAIFLPLSEKLLGFKIIQSKSLPEKIQVTLEREPDFIRIVTTAEQETFILHLEFQTTNDPEMVYRQAEYKAILQRKFKLPVRQFVLYLGAQKLSMKTELPPEQHIVGFELKNMLDFAYEDLAASTIPEEIMLAILGDFHGVPPETVIRAITGRLQQISRGELELKKYIRQLNMLSKLRKLDEQTIKITEHMPIVYDIEQDYLYRKGKEQGKEQGKELATKKAIIEMLRDGTLSIEQIAKFLQVSVDYVLEIQHELDN